MFSIFWTITLALVLLIYGDTFSLWQLLYGLFPYHLSLLDIPELFDKKELLLLIDLSDNGDLD